MNSPVSEQSAYQRLAALCAQSEHCRYDLLVKLRRWGLDGDAAEGIITRLERECFVDEDRYARAFVHDKVHYAKWGRRKIEQALWQKHVDAAAVQRALDTVSDTDYLDILRPLLQQKRRITKAATPYDLKQRLVRFALSRGFTFDLISQVIDVDDE